jgi:hypothetical protein
MPRCGISEFCGSSVPFYVKPSGICFQKQIIEAINGQLLLPGQNPEPGRNHDQSGGRKLVNTQHGGGHAPGWFYPDSVCDEIRAFIMAQFEAAAGRKRMMTVWPVCVGLTG